MIGDVFFIDRFYDCSLVHAKLNQPFSFQGLECLADRGTADAKLCGNVSET